MSKPELIVISQNLMGGGSSFHKNMIENRPDDFFDIKCIYLNPLHWNATRLENLELKKNDIIFSFGNEPINDIASRLNEHISNNEGALVTNLPEELYVLDFYPKTNKTIFFICHDKGFLYLIQKYDYLIDVFIAHNHEVFQEIQKLLPNRTKDIFFIQHGVSVQSFEKKKNDVNNLNLVFLARHVKTKGIYDLPKVNEELVKKGITVNWTILGDGEEKENFVKSVKHLPNFSFKTPKESSEVVEILKNQDIYVLPSSLDGLPVSLLESMSVGVVPIVYNFSEGIKRVITEDIGYVEELKDYHSIAERIVMLHENRDLLRSFSLNCSRKIEEEFNIKIQASLYFDLYKNYKVLKKKKKFSLKRIQNKYDKNKGVKFFFRVLNFLKKKLK